MNRAARVLGYVLIGSFWVGLAALLLLLGMHFFTLAHSPSLPGRAPWDFTAKSYYINFGRSMIQSTPVCVEFDPVLLYKPRDGACEFNNAEFSTVIHSKHGARVNPYLMSAPSTVILGDSYAQGWGVNDDQTVAAILTKRYKEPSLSLGMSSYGTAREVEGFRRYLERTKDRPEFIVFMYCNNDYEENIAYLTSGFVEKTQGDYSKLFEFKGSQSMMSKPYQHVWESFLSLGHGLLTWVKTVPLGGEYPDIYGPKRSVTLDAQVKAFKGVLDKNAELFKGTKIIVSGFYGWSAQDKFSAALLQDPYLSDGSRLYVLPNNLPSIDYYPFDGHLNPKGNEDFAGDVSSLITKLRH